ncbi:MAG: class I adenylate-forming enzyme family protein [Alphaproteobacteria bacterium]
MTTKFTTGVADGSVATQIAVSARLSVYQMFREQAHRQPDALAVEMGPVQRSYGQLLDRVDRTATILRDKGVGQGDRIALISQNRIEYIEMILAAGRIGAIVACQNWRLAVPELQYCVGLVSPALVVASERFESLVADLELGAVPTLWFDGAYDGLVQSVSPDTQETDVDPEDGLVLIYTSGTTGLPKGALISHRAEIIRMMNLRLDLGVDPEDAYMAWAPMFHIGGTEHSLSALMMGGFVVVADGLDTDAIIDALEAHRLGWLLLVPSTIEPLLEALKERGPTIKGVKVVGCMADLVPKAVIEEISMALDAAFFNSFGATETGLPPLSGHLLPPGADLSNLGKRPSSLCSFRLLDPDGHEVAQGETGEAAMKGPTLFSGYWGAEDTNRNDFRDGWFRMGDLFTQDDSGSYHFVGRAKYLIKSGGENIYPAEIERVLLADPRVGDAIVVRTPDDRWGEVPAAVIARNGDDFSISDVEDLCRDALAGYKRPKRIYFRDLESFPRSSSGKIMREEVEKWVEKQP